MVLERATANAGFRPLAGVHRGSNVGAEASHDVKRRGSRYKRLLYSVSEPGRERRARR